MLLNKVREGEKKKSITLFQIFPANPIHRLVESRPHPINRLSNNHLLQLCSFYLATLIYAVKIKLLSVNNFASIRSGFLFSIDSAQSSGAGILEL